MVFTPAHLARNNHPMPSHHALGYRHINGMRKPPSDLSRALAALLRDLLGTLILAFAILMPILIAGFLNA